MAYEFFCSYARANNNDYLKRFFKDLSDRQNAYHWCVLIPWNDADPDLNADRPRIEAAINQTFPFHGGLTKNPMFYRDGIRKAVQELKLTVGEVLARLKEEIKKQAPIQMPIPTGPSKAVINGPAVGTR